MDFNKGIETAGAVVGVAITRVGVAIGVDVAVSILAVGDESEVGVASGVAD